MGQASGDNEQGRARPCDNKRFVIDPVLGIIKADIGIKNGLIAGVGKAGNANVMDGVDMIVASGTEVISGEDTICTSGTIDTHIHFISP
jgi:urease subunit alpha